MDGSELADLVLKIDGRVLASWQFYAATVIAVIGWLVTRKRGITIRVKVLVTAGFVAFISMNIYGLLSAYLLLDAAVADLRSLPALQQLPNIREVLNSHQPPNRYLQIFSIHLLAGGLLVWALWFTRTTADEEG